MKERPKIILIKWALISAQTIPLLETLNVGLNCILQIIGVRGRECLCACACV